MNKKRVYMYTEKDKKIFDKIVKQLNENAEKRKTKSKTHELKSSFAKVQE